MAIGCHLRNLPSHKDPPFSKSKVYHTEIKPDAATLKLEITQQWKAYHYSSRQPCPANWRIEKFINFLMADPILLSEEFDLDWLVTEMHEWKGIQEMINKSQQRQDDQVFIILGHPTSHFSISIIHWLMFPSELFFVKHILPRRGRN